MRESPVASAASFPSESGPPSSAVRLTDAHVAFQGRVVLDGLSLNLPSGTVTALLGPSGVGKTTLLRLVAGLTPPTGPTRVETTGPIAWMGQQDLLFPWLSVLENVLIGDRLRGHRRDPHRTAQAMDLLVQVGLADRAAALPAQLSGGMRQRAALARTLMEDRPIVLMDEPFSSLDAVTRLQMQDLAARLLAGRTVLMVTHDPLEALRLADTVLVLSGTPATLSPPIHPEGPAPRPADDAALLATQGRLLRLLADGMQP